MSSKDGNMTLWAPPKSWDHSEVINSDIVLEMDANRTDEEEEEEEHFQNIPLKPTQETPNEIIPAKQIKKEETESEEESDGWEV